MRQVVLLKQEMQSSKQKAVPSLLRTCSLSLSSGYVQLSILDEKDEIVLEQTAFEMQAERLVK